jgi:hypothetical protein
MEVYLRSLRLYVPSTYRIASLILKRAPIGWNQGDYDVLEDAVVVGARRMAMRLGARCDRGVRQELATAIGRAGLLWLPVIFPLASQGNFWEEGEGANQA